MDDTPKSGFVLAARADSRRAVLVQRDIDDDRLAADLAIFGVLLLIARGIIDEDGDDLAAIRAMDIGGR